MACMDLFYISLIGKSMKSTISHHSIVWRQVSVSVSVGAWLDDLMHPAGKLSVTVTAWPLGRLWLQRPATSNPKGFTLCKSKPRPHTKIRPHKIASYANSVIKFPPKFPLIFRLKTGD